MAVNIPNGIKSRLEAFNCNEDLKLSSGYLYINPPPVDGRCDCCGKHLGELKPFSVFGHTSGIDIEGALLVKTWRPMAPPDEETDRIMEDFLGAASTMKTIRKLSRGS